MQSRSEAACKRVQPTAASVWTRWTMWPRTFFETISHSCTLIGLLWQRSSDLTLAVWENMTMPNNNTAVMSYGVTFLLTYNLSKCFDSYGVKKKTFLTMFS